MSNPDRITSPEDQSLDALCRALAERAGELDRQEAWPHEQLALCAKLGVFEWFLPREWGGQEWSEKDIIRAYLRLSAACLTTTFIITQLTGAGRRIATCQNDALKRRLLGQLAAGTQLATLGISHLTTSRRHLRRPVLCAQSRNGEFQLDGYSPWVTGACYVDYAVTGAMLDDGQQLLVVLPMNFAGVTVPAAERLVGLTASQTGPVRLSGVKLGKDWVIAGPSENVMQQGVGARTGGLETSTLAVGLASAAIAYLNSESAGRPDLSGPAQQLDEELGLVRSGLLAAAGGDATLSNAQLRVRANELALRSSQAALAAAKGTGYVHGHPAGRWCREALFFLVWSCPQRVVSAHLCALAGMED